MKTAKEMFEDLNFAYSNIGNEIIYTVPSEAIIIHFDLIEERVIYDDVDYATIIHMDVLKAIYQQCNELGWIKPTNTTESNVTKCKWCGCEIKEDHKGYCSELCREYGEEWERNKQIAKKF